tara:strand:- start:257 stop:1123 length:867 start_codon:yes stop_codon:yes gene_type:complete
VNRIFLILFLLVTSASFGQRNDSIKKQESFRIRAYKPIYFLFANYTNRINASPISGNMANNVVTPQNLDATELKFQLSFKAKIVRVKKIFGLTLNADTWVGYTQTSRWQFYNTVESRPFRETNYEPEIFITIPFDSESEKWKGIFWGFGFNHQSNGRALPFSRSWNRLIFQLGIEKENYSIILKPWLRIEEDAIDDDNPGIQNFLGRFDLTAAYKKGRNNLSVSIRHSLRFGNQNRGSFRFDYSYQAFGYLKIHTQIFHGYGESLLDYNHKQTTFGLGISLIDWLDKF